MNTSIMERQQSTFEMRKGWNLCKHANVIINASSRFAALSSLWRLESNIIGIN